MDSRLEDWSARFKEAGGDKSDIPIEWKCSATGEPKAYVDTTDEGFITLGTFAGRYTGWSHQGFVKDDRFTPDIPEEVIEACAQGPDFVERYKESL